MQRPLIRIHRYLNRNGRFKIRIADFTGEVRKRGKSHCKQDRRFADFARVGLQKVAVRFFTAAPVDLTDLAALHRFRIRAKELRYAIEMLAGVFPPALRERHYPLVTAIQGALGEINDFATQRLRLYKRLEDCSNVAETDQLRALLQEVRNEIEQRLIDLRKSCSSQRLFDMCAEFNAILMGKPTTAATVY